ncbi:MAG: sulfurtransferase-like selenium metabolism protein YedF [Dethiobacter sp.]|jgi:tRNA 2-thiouridine synthesizing protein A|nr:MAG: sulfurtransferase-like selenium metabolism protein YedF [Dethiobacter sp.]
MSSYYGEVDNRSLSCPQPVINTKKALEELLKNSIAEFTLVSIVDNDSAAENVTRFARKAGYHIEAQKKEDGIYVIINKHPEAAALEKESVLEAEEHYFCRDDPNAEETVFVVSSATLGQGEEELGKILMHSFIYALKEAASLPSKLLFLNSGVFLTAKGSPVLEDLKQLQEKGVEIFSCGTCLDYYHLKDKLEVGKITNMYDIVDYINEAARCINI